MPKCAGKGRVLGVFELEALEGCFVQLVGKLCNEV